ncbi:hypothetical protein E4U54_000627 [Claviceps lovelessii]|nr:hypothetical protein E4U54_000627 [Claviceps lovelessii]
MALGLQVLSRELLDEKTSPLGTQSRALIITPRPAGEVLRSLRESFAAQMQTTGAADSDADNDGRVLADCLDRAMLSCVFDMDGLCEVLSDLDEDDNAEAEAEADNHQMEMHKTREIQDSQDAEEEALLSTVPPPPPPDDNSKNSKRDRKKDSMPSFILITHFSTLLGGLFAQRERQAAHATVSQVGARLGHLSRNLASSPLIMILNSVTETRDTVDRTRKSRVHGHAQGPSTTTAAALDPSLQSIFSPPLLDIPGYNAGNMPRRVKPSFGLVFAQLLDMHLLCSRVARTGHDGTKTETETETETGGVVSERGNDNGNDNDNERGEIHGSGASFVTIVEVLMDDMGVWQGRRGPRPSREQRWTAVDVVRGRVSCDM